MTSVASGSSIVFAAIVPHGDIIPALSKPKMVEKTRGLVAAMELIEKRCFDAKPDTVIVMTPHGVRIEDSICIAVTERAAGSLTENGAMIAADMLLDQELARAIEMEARDNCVPIASAIYGSSAGPSSCIPLDWGALVPLWYLGARWEHQPKVAVVVPSRTVPYDKLVQFGRSLVRAVDSVGRRVAVIASADWSHAHYADGPYGYHSAAKELDEQVLRIVKSGKLHELGELPDDLIECALPDGIWQCLMLAGALEDTNLIPQFLTYECPSYYGMLCAIWS